MRNESIRDGHVFKKIICIGCGGRLFDADVTRTDRILPVVCEVRCKCDKCGGIMLVDLMTQTVERA